MLRDTAKDLKIQHLPQIVDQLDAQLDMEDGTGLASWTIHECISCLREQDIELDFQMVSWQSTYIFCGTGNATLALLNQVPHTTWGS